ncbi:MAG: hypothetical protein U0269_04680 [Polyangiales bacterium]
MSDAPANRAAHTALYTSTIFASALLLFFVQPLAGRALLPRLGGVPSVWNACLLFFQGALLAGYGYVWLSSRWSERARVAVHCALLALAAVALPAFAARVDESRAVSSPVLFALEFLSRSVGAPFVLLSATSPLLQHWLSKSGARPYGLYAASNVGSLGSLLLYPFVIEPRLSLLAQTTLFRRSFAIVAALIALCAIPALRASASGAPSAPPAPLSRERVTRWVLWSAVPTMLLSGSTTHLTTDLAPFPLLWVVPLALYLASFVVAFSTGISAPPSWLARAASLVAVVLIFSLSVHANEPVWVLGALNMAFLFVAAWIAHRRLADDAPDPAHLPQFYAWIAFGGALGTLVTAVLAPALLPDLWEYPLAIALATSTRPLAGVVREDEALTKDVANAFAIAVIVLVLAKALSMWAPSDSELTIAFAPGLLLAYRTMPQRRKYALSLLALVVAGALVQDRGVRRYTTRSFFGVLRVVDEGDVRRLMHGTTIHGAQRISQRNRCEPMTYYARSGPLGALFESERARAATGRTVAIGLGTGAVLCYANESEPWRALEISADVIRVAREPQWFTFVANSPTRRASIELADGRLGILSERDHSLVRVVVDAFNSDSVPAHLITREALAIYRRKIREDGRIVMHLSNRVLDLERVLASVVAAEGMHARVSAPNDIATWAIVANSEAHLRDLDPRRWLPLRARAEDRAWSDDYSSLFPVIRRGR